MPSDIITNNIAEICLATECAALCDSPSGIMLAGPDFAIPVRDTVLETQTGLDLKTCPLADYLDITNFEGAALAISESVAAASVSTDLKIAQSYVNLLKHLETTPMLGRVLLTPIGGIWPDIMKEFVPWIRDNKPNPDAVHDRIFPVLKHIDAIALMISDGTDIDTWCADNPRLLAWDGDVCCGWNSQAMRVVRVNIETVDFRKPWRIIRQPDGSEIISPATPLALKSPMLSYYETVDSKSLIQPE